MSLVSFSFFIMVLIAVPVYYTIPGKFKWLALLICNIFFLVSVNTPALMITWAVSAVLTYLFGVLIKFYKGSIGSKIITTVGVILIAGCMLYLKDLNFFAGIVAGISGSPLTHFTFLAPLGISYYTLTWIGYLLDIYWGVAKPETNLLKFLTFAGYFPLLTSGPVVSFKTTEKEIITSHDFDLDRISKGFFRVLFGLTKKLIISERLAAFVNSVYDDPLLLPGFYVWIAMFMFVLQLYTDFSGCIDIALGVSTMFGIELPENFDTPFISRSLEEFWRRWHITLGAWLKEYILYPLLKSSLFQKLAEVCKKAFGKKAGKKIPTWIGLLISWFLIGFWHGGGWNYIIGVGLFFGVVIILSDMLKPVFDKLISLLRINTNAFSWHFFQSVRTFVIFMFGLSFFRAYDGLESAFGIWKAALAVFNPWIFFDGSLYTLGITATDYRILIFFMGIVVAFGIIRVITKKSAWDWMLEQNLIFRWIVYLILIYGIIIYGCYGEGFSSASFIYQKF